MDSEDGSGEVVESSPTRAKRQRTLCKEIDAGPSTSFLAEPKLFDLSVTPEVVKKKGVLREFNWTNVAFGQFLLKIVYLGTQYSGLAWQPASSGSTASAAASVSTIEGKIFEALKKTCLIRDRKSCHFSRCGRTDKGVHAAGNYICVRLRLKPGFEASDSCGGFDYPALLNSVLPMDIRIVDCRRVPDHFDARFQCLYRVYKYLFLNQGLDLNKMIDASRFYVGEHDFRNFCKIDADRARHFRRKILWIKFRLVDPPDVWEAEIAGLSFLWHQIRAMMAVLFLVGKGLEEPDVIPTMLDIDKTPAKPGYELASDMGLILYDCFFEGLYFGKSEEQSSHLESLKDMYFEHKHLAAVCRCLTTNGRFDSGVRAPCPSQSVMQRQSHRKYIPLLKREAGPTLEQRKMNMKEKQEAKMADTPGKL